LEVIVGRHDVAIEATARPGERMEFAAVRLPPTQLGRAVDAARRCIGVDLLSDRTELKTRGPRQSQDPKSEPF
jgi:hypothetical protein